MVACALVAAHRASAQIAIIVSPAAAIRDLTIEEVRRIFSGDAVTIDGSTPSRVVFHEDTQRAFFQSFYGKSVEVARRHWIELVFRGENTPPRTMADLAEIKRFVANTAGAIAFIPATAADGSIRIVKVGGKLPTEAGYSLK